VTAWRVTFFVHTNCLETEWQNSLYVNGEAALAQSRIRILELPFLGARRCRAHTFKCFRPFFWAVSGENVQAIVTRQAVTLCIDAGKSTKMVFIYLR
jgi:hypothetical protein